MINTKENKTNNENINPEQITFFSIKNNCSFNCKSEEVKRFMTLFEIDGSMNKYQPFDFMWVSTNTGETQLYQAFKTEDGATITYIIFCDYLATNEKYSDYMAHQMQQSQTLPIELCSAPTAALCSDDVVIDNAVFLYEFALLPLQWAAFNLIRQITTGISEISVGRLKQLVKNDTAIYQLIFHYALRADLGTELLNDNTMVDASPLFNSIIKNLTEKHGGQSEN
jgi:hypothetical protein